MAFAATLAFFAVAATPGGLSAPAHVPTKAVAPAQASVRILPGARISLSASSQPDGHAMKPARITVEDGSRRTAQLVEFQ